ncbi:hypothetical protein JW868_01305 [Candidatus Woesearchaeota archaeon]|nr:hypothetical protein [Candidatus Woesearchaeota archaeon]
MRIKNEAQASAFVLALITMLLLQGCSSPDTPDNNIQPFVGGIEGLAMIYQEQAPPDEIFDDGQFPFAITVLVENVGEEDLFYSDDFAEVRVVGINPSYFVEGGDPDYFRKNLLFDSDLEVLRGAAKLPDGTEVPGDITSISFDNLNYKPDLQGSDEMLIRTELCYDYQTITTASVCIKDDIIANLGDDKICSVDEFKVPHNSGGPVHITQVKQYPGGRNSIVSFTIEHVGTGMIFKHSSENPMKYPCEDTLTNLYENWVYIDVSMDPNAGIDVECPLLGQGHTGYIQLFQGEPRVIQCTLKGDKDRNRIFQDVIRVEMDYTYLQFVEKPVVIRDVSSFEPV